MTETPSRFSAAWARDAFERVAATFVEAALGAFALDRISEGATGADLLDVGRGAALAGLVAAAALLKTLVGGLVGRPSSASLDPDVAGPVAGPVIPSS